jgi:Mn-dependent DtxR family transcriptional regulator
MTDQTMEDIKAQIVEYFKKKGKMMTSRDVAKGLELDNRTAKSALTELINAGTLEFTSFGGATFIKLPDA